MLKLVPFGSDPKKEKALKVKSGVGIILLIVGFTLQLASNWMKAPQ